MTIPVPRSSADGVGVSHPNNSYFIPEIPEEGIELLPEENNDQDPTILLSAQLRNSLYVTTRTEFTSNVPEIVFKDFIARGERWKTYVEQGGWKNFDRAHRLIAKMVATSIMQEYILLGCIGQQRRCMFGLEKIALHLRDVISMETFFSSLIE